MTNDPVDASKADEPPEDAAPTDTTPETIMGDAEPAAARHDAEPDGRDGNDPVDPAARDGETPTDPAAPDTGSDSAPGNSTPGFPGAGYPGATDPGATDPGPGYPGPTQPTTGGYAAQFGLIRPYQGRYIAGVCAGLGRATNTDPVLWRVLLPVLTLLGGLGGLLYLLGWLLMPAEGDSASPLEALAGRGHSSTSRPATIALSVLAALTMFGGLTRVSTGLFVVAAVVGGVVLLATSRADAPAGWPRVRREPGGFTVNWMPPPAGTTGPDAAPMTMAPPAWAAPATPSAASDAPTRTDIPTVLADAPPVDAETPGPAAPTYQPPFAPHGPYAYPPAPFPGLAPTTMLPPPPPKAKKRRSPARRVIISAAAIVVGLLAVLDTSNAWSVPIAMYFAAALATIGLGLVVGAFFGRTRGPITLGVLLTICLLISTAVDHSQGSFASRTVTIAPASVAAINDNYDQRVGRLTLDLSHVNFAGTARSIDIDLTVGRITVILPPNVDATVVAKAEVGSAHAFSHGRDGINQGSLSASDNGADGPGGGSVNIHAHVTVGQVEVIR